MGGFLNIFGDWSKGDFLADDGIFGGVRDNQGNEQRLDARRMYEQNDKGKKEVYRSGNYGYNYAGDIVKTYNDPQKNNPTEEYQQGSYGSIGGGAGGGGAASTQAAREKGITLGMLDESERALRDRERNLDTTWSAGRNQLDDGYNKNLSRLNEQRSNALTRYGVQRKDSRSDFERGSEDVDQEASSNYHALMNLLGQRGAGSSSTAQNVVPHAVSQNASKQRGSMADTYGRNVRDLMFLSSTTLLYDVRLCDERPSRSSIERVKQN